MVFLVGGGGGSVCVGGGGGEVLFVAFFNFVVFCVVVVFEGESWAQHRSSLFHTNVASHRMSITFRLVIGPAAQARCCGKAMEGTSSRSNSEHWFTTSLLLEGNVPESEAWATVCVQCTRIRLSPFSRSLSAANASDTEKKGTERKTYFQRERKYPSQLVVFVCVCVLTLVLVVFLVVVARGMGGGGRKIIVPCQ